jgi:hypothetical protein
MIPLNSKLLRNLSLPFLITGLIGCTSLVNLGIPVPFTHDPITLIKEVPQQQPDSTLYLQGKVSELVPFLGNGAYQLQDQTGKIWIRTHQNLPKLGEQITIKGQVKYQSIAISNQEMGEFYLVELEQVGPSNSTSETSQPENKPTTTPVEDLLLPHKQQEK